MRRAALVALVLALMVPVLSADVVDVGSEPAPVLAELVDAFDDVGIDVLYDHASERGRVGPSYGDRPRVAPLFGFRAMTDVDVDLARHADWLDAFESGARGAIAAVPTDAEQRRPTPHEFARLWRGAEGGARVVVTFDAADLAAAQHVAGALVEHGYAVLLALADPDRETLDPETLGRLFVEAEHCLTLDTASARLNAVIQFEAELLAELRRQEAWLASNDEGLPPLKRGPMDVIESLGALSMKVVPGGIVLGMTPELEAELAGALLAVEGSDYGVIAGGAHHVLEQVSTETQEAISAFVANADSHAVVDIAGGHVTLAAPLDGTRIGKRMIDADHMPFEYLSVSGAQKSVIVDERIHMRRDGDGEVVADVTLEVRFYRRDDDGHAHRLATLRFTVEDATGAQRLLDLAWSRHPDTRIGFDGSGVDALVDDLEQLALDAALIGMARLPG